MPPWDPAAPPTKVEFERAARAFLESRFARRQALAYGLGSDVVPVFDSPEEDAEVCLLAVVRAWLRDRFDAGFTWIDGPTALGGGGLTAGHADLYAALEQKYATPALDLLIPSLRIVAPALGACASDDQKAALLPRLRRGDLVGCQLFSEPGAGSDLANIRTSARREGDSWIIDGQKVWTTGAHFSDIGLLIARTSSEGPPHRGLTAFVVDMHAPGIDIRPIRHMGGQRHFNEIFFDGLRIPDTARVGEIGGGWQVIIATLMGEREALGASEETPPLEVAERLELLIRHSPDLGAHARAIACDAAMRVRILAEVLDLTNTRLRAETVKRGTPGPEASISKLLKNALLRLATDTAGAVLGPRMIAETGVWGTLAWGRAAVLAPGLRIGGGTDEIQKNTLAERVLGLPKEPRPAAKP